MITTLIRFQKTPNHINQSVTRCAVVFFIVNLILSCQSNTQKIDALVNDNREPIVSSEGVELVYTKNGTLSHKLTSPKVLKFIEEQEYIEFPLGLEIFSFNAEGEQEAFMRSDYAIQHLEDKTIEAKGAVLIENLKGEKLETEFLVWNKNRNEIFTEELVKITKKGQSIIGYGFESNTSFSKYTLKNTRGIINLDQPE